MVGKRNVGLGLIVGQGWNWKMEICERIFFKILVSILNLIYVEFNTGKINRTLKIIKKVLNKLSLCQRDPS